MHAAGDVANGDEAQGNNGATSLESYSRGESVWSPGFLSLLLTQFFTALCDHSYRWYAIGVAKDYAPADAAAAADYNARMLAVGTLSFVLPCLLFAAPAGWLADRFNKRTVIVGCKVAELFMLAIGLLGVWTGQLWLMFSALALLGTQTTLFVPAKVGAIPELLSPQQLSKANGAFQLITIVAMVAGVVLGSWLSDTCGQYGREQFFPAVYTFGAIALVGLAVSFGIGALRKGDVARPFPWNLAGQTWRDLRALGAHLPLLRVALGIMFFYAIGNLAQLNIDQLATVSGAQTEAAKSPLLIALIAGVSCGALLAGIASGDRVELGILPLGAAGVAVSAMLLFTVPRELFETGTTVTGPLAWACVLLFCLGTSSGLFLVPLEAYLQHHSDPNHRGAVLAAANFITCVGTLLTSGLFALLVEWKTSPRMVFFLAGVATIPVFLYMVWLIPGALIRFVVWLASHTIYRITVTGREHLPPRGGAVLTPNHVSWADPVLILVASSRPIRMVAWSGNFQSRFMLWLADLFGVILVNPTRPKMIVAALRTARQAVLDGELVCIFPEGGITRSGHLLAFRTGLMKILEGTSAPVIPVYLEGLWGSIFSFERGKFFWKWPRRLPYPVSLHFGAPLPRPDDLEAVKRSVAELGALATQDRMQRIMLLPSAFLRSCKKKLRTIKVADTLGGKLTGGEVLLRTLILRRILRRQVLAADEKCVGVLLPPSAAGVLANVALALDKRVTVNLNYTVKADVMNFCLREAGVRHVLTSRRFLDKLGLTGLEAEIVYLEDFKTAATWTDKLVAAVQAYATPAPVLERVLGLSQIRANDLATIIFTSGSTGTPKGVMVSHGNLAFNVEAIDQVVQLRSTDVLLGVLPFFHVFGYTVALWGVAGLDIQGAYHFSPLDAKFIGRLCQEYGGTILLATPTFLRSYIRRCEPEELKTLQVVVTGAEKLPPDVATAFQEKFGVEPVEGFGATETTPLVSVNVPPSRQRGDWHLEAKRGTVGMPVSGVSVRIMSLETGEPLPAGQTGMVHVKGPNIMQGYLNRPDLTAEVLQDGWYITGDLGLIDEDGFLKITGRQSRFSKIGGEMVPHIQIEEAINQLVGATDDEMKAAVTAIADERKGERLVVLHTGLPKTPEEIRKALTDMGLPNLFLPGEDSFVQVEAIPVLGTGKLDLKGLKNLAESRLQSADPTE